MPTGYTRSPKLLKGALVELSEEFLGQIPNIVVFNDNSELLSVLILYNFTMRTHKLSE